MSKYDGQFEFELKGRRLTICYDWAALSLLSDYPNSLPEVSKPIAEINPERIAEVLSCGLIANHPDMTKDAIMEWSPPLIRSVMVIDKALSYAYYGPDGPSALDKKKLTKPLKKTLWQRLFR